jgi:hypothetical protein
MLTTYPNRYMLKTLCGFHKKVKQIHKSINRQLFVLSERNDFQLHHVNLIELVRCLHNFYKLWL